MWRRWEGRKRQLAGWRQRPPLLLLLPLLPTCSYSHTGNDSLRYSSNYIHLLCCCGWWRRFYSTCHRFTSFFFFSYRFRADELFIGFSWLCCAVPFFFYSEFRCQHSTAFECYHVNRGSMVAVVRLNFSFMLHFVQRRVTISLTTVHVEEARAFKPRRKQLYQSMTWTAIAVAAVASLAVVGEWSVPDLTTGSRAVGAWWRPSCESGQRADTQPRSHRMAALAALCSVYRPQCTVRNPEINKSIVKDSYIFLYIYKQTFTQNSNKKKTWRKRQYLIFL